MVTACGILAPPPGIEPTSFALAAQSLNPWTAKDVPSLLFLMMCVMSLSHTGLFATPWTIVCQTPLSMEFSRQEY